jgi:hypothetical protein
MGTVWRFLTAWTRRLPIGLFAFAMLGLALASGAMAQSSVGRAANTATGQSLRDAVEQQQNETLNSSGVGAGGSSVGAAIGAGASPTGRLRSSNHDALKLQAPPDDSNYAWKTKEGSVFGTGVYTLPGTILGGQMKVSIFGGHNWLSLEMKNGGGNFLDVDNGQFGKARNESVLVGGTALWSQNNTYVVATMVGMWGETSLTDAVDFCNAPGLGCPPRHYAYDTSGFTGSLTAGQVFPLSKSPSGPMLDLRGAAGYTQNTGDHFFNFQGDEQKYKFSVWTLTGSATLFANIAMQNSALLRPYIQGYVRQEIGYNNKLYADEIADPPELVHWDQAHTYAGVDLGATYALGNMTLGAAVYYDASADDRTFGGRLGASWKLN